MLRENVIAVYNCIKILFELKDSFGANRNKWGGGGGEHQNQTK